MEKRALLAFVLSMAIFILWGLLFSPTPPTDSPVKEASPPAPAEEGLPPAEDLESLSQDEPEPVAKTDKLEKAPDVPVRDITVKTDLYTAVFTEKGGRLKSLTLNRYLSENKASSPPKELVVVSSPQDYPLALSFKKHANMDLAEAYFKSSGDKLIQVPPGQEISLIMTFKRPDGFEIERTYSFRSDSYLIGLKDTLRNRSAETMDDNLLLSLSSLPITNKERYAGFTAYINNDLLQIKPADVKEELNSLNQEKYNLTWAAYEDQYFMAALLPQDQEKTRLKASSYEDGVQLEFINPPIRMKPQTQKTYQYTIFYGPKDYQLLKSMDNTLERAIYFGWFDILSKPLLILMTWLYGFVGNYGVVIIIVTIIIKILFWPLTAKSYKSMKAMQKLQPQVMRLREKFKDDRQAMNAEMMQLYRTYKVNPLGGCLPMVIQIPVFIALYRLLDYSLELRHAPFALWIRDLAAPDRLFHFSFQLPFMEPPSGIPVLTLLMGASMLLQQKMTPTPGDPTQAKIMMFMPIFFTFIFINFPSGLVLYWLVNNLLSIGQQYLINKRP